MLLEKLLRVLREEPMAITGSAHGSIRDLLLSKVTSGTFVRDGIGMCGEAVNLQGMEITGGVASIPISGAIGQGLNGFAKGAGAVDVADVWAEIDQAEADQSVQSIAFIIDSPGGMVSGTPELAARISQIKKPKYTFAAGQVASAAYWLASQTDGIFATETSELGSVGVYLPAVDQVEAYRAAGLKVDLIKAGKFKGIGFPGIQMTEEQRAHLQERVDQIFEMFKNQVLANRPSIKSKAMDGQTFLGADAVKVGLADVLVGSKSEFLKMIGQTV